MDEDEEALEQMELEIVEKEQEIISAKIQQIESKGML